MTHRLIYVTASNLEEAKSIGQKLVDERLVACVNILPHMTSIYRWQGKVEEAEEVVMIVKTTEQLVERTIVRAKQLHSYECPCVVAVPIVAGNPDFLAWISGETG
jgi:periplasmic divalent cation tolerance protein